jgi:hypothetical protein
MGRGLGGWGWGFGLLAGLGIGLGLGGCEGWGLRRDRGAQSTAQDRLQEGQGSAIAAAQTPATVDLTGSLWRLSYRDPVEETERRYRIGLRPGGQLLNGDDQDTTVGNDTWSQRGDRVTLSFNNGYAVYEGRLAANGQRLEGTARNANGTWPWRGDRLPQSADIPKP